MSKFYTCNFELHSSLKGKVYFFFISLGITIERIAKWVIVVYLRNIGHFCHADLSNEARSKKTITEEF